MSNDSRIAVSFAPAYFHHWRSNSRISRSRSPRPAAASRLGCAAASMRGLPSAVGAGRRTGRAAPADAASLREEFHRCHSLAARRAVPSDGPMTTSTTGPSTGWGILATGKIAHSFAADLHAVPGAVIAAVGSRFPQSAEAFAREVGDDRTRAHASY